MIKINHFFILVLFFSTQRLQSQIQYGGIQQCALVFSESRSNLGFHMINGIRFKRFFTGVGVDAEFARRQYYYYYYMPGSFNTSAVYADVRYYINKKKNFFVLTDLGANFITERLSFGESGKYKKQVGYYGSIGLGFKARIGKELFYSFDVSYCMKQSRYDYSYKTYIPAREQTDKYDIRKNCILVRMGIEIF